MPRGHAPARTDANQAALMAVARQLGGLVVDTHTVGGACGDFYIWWRGVWLAVECKQASGRLTEQQREVQALWPGAVKVVRSVEELVKLMGGVDQGKKGGGVEC